MKFTFEMPVVAACAVLDCAYNGEQRCHARAITIGADGSLPRCDTFLRSSKHTHAAAQSAGVGSCKATACRHNQDFACQAPDGIRVAGGGAAPRCATFSKRSPAPE